jgi:hypothetical protein
MVENLPKITHNPPTPEERVKNRTLARAIARKGLVVAKEMTDEQLNEDPFCIWLEALIHDIRLNNL